MGDPERRAAVIEWVRTVGEPWIQSEHPPAPGSPLAGDDKAQPKVSAIARFGIATAVDHLGLVVDAMESDRPFRVYAPLTVLRTVLYASAHTEWLLTPTTRVGRQVRALRMELRNQVEQRKAISGFTGDHVSADLVEERDKAVDSVKARIEILKERGANLVDGMAAEDARAHLGGPVLTEPLNMVEILQSLVDEHSYAGQGIRHLWRTGSAAAHGYHWGAMHAGSASEFNMSLYGSMMMVKDALELYENRATNHLAQA